MKHKRLRPARRGAAMLIAMALILGLTALVASIQYLMASSFNTTKKERDYERALQMAEHGINMTLYNLNNNLGSTPTALVTVPTIPCFKAGVLAHTPTYVMTKYPTNSSATGYYVGSIGAIGDTGTLIAFGWSNGTIRRIKVNIQSQSFFNGTAAHALSKGLTNSNNSTTWSTQSTDYSLRLATGTQVIGAIGSCGGIDFATNNGSQVFVGPVYISGDTGRFNESSYPSRGTYPGSAYPTYTPPAQFTGSPTGTTPFVQTRATPKYVPTADKACNDWVKLTRDETSGFGVDYFAGSSTVCGVTTTNSNNSTGLRYLVWKNSNTSTIRELGPKDSTTDYQVIQSGNTLDHAAFQPSGSVVRNAIKPNSDWRSGESIYGVRVYPGDYYFDSINMTLANDNLFIRSFSDSEGGTIPSSGTLRPFNFGTGANPNFRPVGGHPTSLADESTVHFWIGNPASGPNPGAVFTDHVYMEYTQYASRLRCYSANVTGVTINAGNSNPPLSSRLNVLAYNQRAGLNGGLPYGLMTITGSSYLFGSLIGYQVNLGGSTTVQQETPELTAGDRSNYVVSSTTASGPGWTELQ